MAYPEDYPDNLTKAKAQGYLHKHMRVVVDGTTGLPAMTGPDVQQYLARMITPPSTLVKNAIDAFLRGLWTDGVYQKLDAAWIMNLHTEQASRLNIISSSYTLTDVGAAPTWATGVGGAGGFTATSAAMNTGFAVAIHGKNMGRDSAHISLRSWTSAVSASHDVGQTSCFFNARFTGDVLIGRINASSNDSEANPDGAGFFAIERATDADFRYYRTGIALTLEAEPSIAPASANPLWVCGMNSSSVSSRRQSFVSVGGALGEAGQAALRTRLTIFEAAIGAS